MKPRPDVRMYVSGFSLATRVDPALEQHERHVDGREEQQDEDRRLHQRPGLHRAEAHRDPACPEQPADVHDDRERVEAEQVDAVPADLHVRDQRDDREQDRDEAPAQQRRERVAPDDPAAVLRRDHQPPREAALEVARDPEAGEDAAERRRLQQHEDEHEATCSRP